MRVALLLGEGREVRRILDDLKTIVGAAVTSYDAVAVGDAHLLLRRDERERLAHEGVRDGIVVEIEADVRRLAVSLRQALGNRPALWCDSRARRRRTMGHDKNRRKDLDTTREALAVGVRRTAAWPANPGGALVGRG